MQNLGLARKYRTMAENVVRNSGASESQGFFGWLDKKFSLDAIFGEGIPPSLIPKISFIAFIGVLYIGNRHYAEKNTRAISKIERQVEDLRTDYTSLKSDYMLSSKRSAVAERVEILGLEECQTPPFTITVQKGEF